MGSGMVWRKEEGRSESGEWQGRTRVEERGEYESHMMCAHMELSKGYHSFIQLIYYIEINITLKIKSGLFNNVKFSMQQMVVRKIETVLGSSKGHNKICPRSTSRNNNKNLI